eukprot:CAMPEP_0206440292 /NCGR_PEP_ID=MMETSP0324_2-20121206/12680_1 /ASSEMBLY_ACC=CAM_ASM_000836 /TAXON_ID=2866 /ORGANISM="Crypthecodinium cohnii, Strain Seligo" /LENGTH=588 /DNA_ID=CAMNT_0053907997 /DNA_START=83 /DNA_END=1850 /DNA_ORIENTATION=-
MSLLCLLSGPDWQQEAGGSSPPQWKLGAQCFAHSEPNDQRLGLSSASGLSHKFSGPRRPGFGDVKYGQRRAAGTQQRKIQCQTPFQVRDRAVDDVTWELTEAPDSTPARAGNPTGRANATFEMLNEVPEDVLDEASPQAQELRRKLTKGATVVFVSAGYPGKRFIYERAAALGVKSVILDHPDSWSKNLVDEGIIAKFLPVDMSQSSEEVFKEAVRAISELGQDGITGKADGVVTFVELSVPLTSRLAEVLGLPGMSPAAVDAARDKHRTRAALKKAGLPTPSNYLIKQGSELKAAADAVGFPAVLKPVSGAASLGVKKVLNFQELESSYLEVAEELGGLVISSGALIKAATGTKGVNASSVVDLTVLLEQYLDGPEVDVDIVMSDGDWRYAAVSDNGPTSEPYFQEFWGLCPSLLSKQQQTELKDLAINSVKVLGFATGIFHVELKYTSNTGPQLIEVNARLGGGPVRECNRLVWGVDLVEEGIFCALGIPARPCSPPAPYTCIGYTFVNAQKSGKLTSQATAKFEAWRKLPYVLSSVPLARTGDTVVGVKDGLSTWLCELVVTGKTSEEALKYFLELENDAAADIE